LCGVCTRQRSVPFLEGVGDVLEEQQAEGDVPVLGRFHIAAQGLGHLPELGFVADGGGGRVRLASIVLSLGQ